jgi:glycosyltransferase involved in cell wall biosynthesis
MKNIAFICELIGTIRQGGENIAMVRIANSLKDLGNSVDIYSYTDTNPTFKITSSIPLKLRLLPFVREIFFVPFIGYRLIKQLDKTYDATFASSMTIASLIKPKSSLIIVCHLIRSQKFKNLSKVPKYKILFNPLTYFVMTTLERLSLKNANHVIVIREQQKKYLVEKLHINANKISVIPNGIDTNFFKPKNVTKKNQIIFVGRGTIPKGIDTLLQAADAIHAKILIVTQKIDNQFVKIAKHKKNISIKTQATPKEIVKLYSESKIFVLPSLNEEQPLSTIEAMSCGLPVVVTPEAASDIVQDKKHGFIIAERNPNQLADKINYLLGNEKVRVAMSKENRKRIIEKYNLHHITEMTQNLLND